MNYCPAPVEVYSRVVGFFRPTRFWNHGKKEEYRERVTYNLSLGKEKAKAKKK